MTKVCYCICDNCGEQVAKDVAHHGYIGAMPSYYQYSPMTPVYSAELRKKAEDFIEFHLCIPCNDAYRKRLAKKDGAAA